MEIPADFRHFGKFHMDSGEMLSEIVYLHS